MPTYNPYPDEHIQNYVKPASGLKKCVYVYKNDRTKFDLTNRMRNITEVRKAYKNSPQYQEYLKRQRGQQKKYRNKMVQFKGADTQR